VVYSDEEDGELARNMEVAVVQAPNTPLTDKHNAGARALMGKVDAVINIPSDDFFTPGFFGFVKTALSNGHDFIRLESLYFASLDSGAAIYGKKLYHGAGTVISKSLLDRVNWHPWIPGLGRPTDAHLLSRCTQHAENPLVVEDFHDYGFVGVDFKQEGANFKSFNELSKGLQHATEANLETITGYFPSIADEILSWNDATKRKRIKKEVPEVLSPAQRSRLESLLSKSKTEGGKIELYWRGDLLKMRRNLTEESFTI